METDGGNVETYARHWTDSAAYSNLAAPKNWVQRCKWEKNYHWVPLHNLETFIFHFFLFQRLVQSSFSSRHSHNRLQFQTVSNIETNTPKYIFINCRKIDTAEHEELSPQQAPTIIHSASRTSSAPKMYAIKTFLLKRISSRMDFIYLSSLAAKQSPAAAQRRMTKNRANFFFLRVRYKVDEYINEVYFPSNFFHLPSQRITRAKK